jgi:hypothetical protein
MILNIKYNLLAGGQALDSSLIALKNLIIAEISSAVAIALAVRTELATELARIDAATSSRAAPGDVPAAATVASQVRTELSTELARIDATVSSRSTAVTMTLVEKILRNKSVTDPTTGVMTIYDDDGVTPLIQADVFEDTAGAQPYRGQGADRRDRLV